MTWNYRILAHEHEDEVYFLIHEVYYDVHGKPDRYSLEAVNVGSNSVEGIKRVLDIMKECINKPILSVDNFPEEWSVKMKSMTELAKESKPSVNSRDADISNVSNPLKVYTYSFFDNSEGFKPKHWAKDLTMVIEKDGVKMKLEGKEIQELVASLPRTFGGSY